MKSAEKLCFAIAITSTLLAGCSDGEVKPPRSSTELAAENKEGFESVEATATLPDVPSSQRDPQQIEGLPSRAKNPTSLTGLGRHTAAEAPFVVKDALDVPTLSRAIQGDWSKTVETFRAESLGDQDATELTRLYGSHLSSAIGQDELKLKEFACGVTMCVGTISSGAEGAYENWYSALSGPDRPPIYSYLDISIEGPSGTDHRFAFSTDETANAFTDRARK